MSLHCSPRPSLMNLAQFLALEVCTRSKVKRFAGPFYLLHPLKDVLGRSVGLSEPKSIGIWLGKSSWLLKQHSTAAPEVPAASQHFTLLALLLIFP